MLGSKNQNFNQTNCSWTSGVELAVSFFWPYESFQTTQSCQLLGESINETVQNRTLTRLMAIFLRVKKEERMAKSGLKFRKLAKITTFCPTLGLQIGYFRCFCEIRTKNGTSKICDAFAHVSDRIYVFFNVSLMALNCTCQSRKSTFSTISVQHFDSRLSSISGPGKTFAVA